MNRATTYIFAENHADRELIRLHRIESALDPFSQALLTKTGIGPGWACLEIGAGAGSILQWLSDQVGSRGRAVGVDKTTKYLRQFTYPPVEIIEGDVLDLKLTDKFDLIHARYVLIHNQRRTEILSKLKTLLKPGGVLVVEEPDFESAAEWIDEKYRTAGERVNGAIRSMFLSMSLDPGCGKRLPDMVSRLGLAAKHIQAIAHLEPSGGPVALVMAESAEALRARYLSTGKVSHEDIDTYIKGARSGHTWAVYYSTIGVICGQDFTES
jgi:SAM-dependent methyltransferase